MSQSACDHSWSFQSLVYWHDDTSMPGSSARYRHYADKYYCTKCLETRLANDRIVGDSYHKLIEGAHPR